MRLKTYVRIANGVVVEILESAGDIIAMFHRDLRWLDVTDVMGIAYGWTYDGSRFTAPVPISIRLPDQ